MKTVLILGSAPNAVSATQFNLEYVDALVALNNAWSIRTDWTHAIYPDDFPPERRPLASANQIIVTYQEYVPANNAYGGIHRRILGAPCFKAPFFVLLRL